MGVVNVTPDSFSGDGIGADSSGAARRAARLEAGGADLIDIGGESTRPGFEPVPEDIELARVIPAIRAAAGAVRIPISVDTSKTNVAQRAIEAGAVVINDVSGLSDPEMPRVAAALGAGMALVHTGGSGEADIMDAVVSGLSLQIEAAIRAGVREEAITVDPGLGLGKNWRLNFEIMRRLEELRRLGFPILIGPSRKGMIGRVLGVSVDDRVEGTIALVTTCIAHGADIVRVHDLPALSRAVAVADALARPREHSGDEATSPR